MPKSLELVPANALFYSSSLRLREQFDACVGSRAFAKLREMPVVQMGWAMFQQQWNNPRGELAQVKAMLEQPENQKLVSLLLDAVSHEVFLYGGEGFGDAMALINEFNQANQSAQLAALSGNADEAGKVIARHVIEALSRRLDTFTIPDTVIGFRLSATEPAQPQLARLEQTLAALLAEYRPEWKERLSRQQIAGHEYLTMKLDGSLIPWDAIPPDPDLPLDDLRAKVSKMTLEISLGVRGEYLLLSLGDDSAHLARLGQGELLATRKELTPLQQHAQHRVAGVGYVSGEFVQKANSAQQQIDQYARMAEGLLPLAQLEPALEQELAADVRRLGEDLKNAIPQVGASSSILFLNDHGYEGFSYSWTEHNWSDGSQPLTILEHVGGDPILVLAGRGKYAPEAYDWLSHWCGRILYYAEKISVERLGDEEREFFDKVRDKLAGLVQRADQVTRDKLLPALRDGQSACVVDAKTTSERWHEALPQSTQPLPMLEVGFVYGVSDVALLKQAAVEYYQIAQQVIDVLHAAEPTKIPELQLPPPESREFPSGTVYFYRLPSATGLDQKISPNAGVSKDTLVLSLIPRLTVRLLEKTTPQLVPLLANREQRASFAFHFNFPRLLAAVSPWVDYGVEQSEGAVAPDVQEQIKTGFEIASCFRGASGLVYQEGDAWATHYEIRFEDLP